MLAHMYVFLHPQLSFGISDLSAEIHLKGRKKGREYFQCDVFNIFSSKINIYKNLRNERHRDSRIAH